MNKDTASQEEQQAKEEEDDDEGSYQPSTTDVAQQCFSVIQSKKFPTPPLLSACKLCPSMDLVVLGMQKPTDPFTAASLRIHRTVSWQRLATLTEFEDVENDKTTIGAAIAAAAATLAAADDSPTKSGACHVAWSPDGRKFAIALPSGNVCLYHVEAMVSSSGGMMGGGGGGGGGSSGDAISQGHLCSIPVARQGIVGLTWAHVGRHHPRWNLTVAEQERDISWGYHTHYLDRAADLLPPSEHHRNHYPNHHDHNHLRTSEDAAYTNSSTLPTCQTPLSLLCASTKGKGLQIFLHGRYRILTLPMMVQRNVNVVCSSDLSSLLVHQEKSMNLSLFAVPALSQQRHHLQIISSLYCSISSHLEALQKHAPEILASWKVSIKPLDTKMDNLVRLLKNYGVSQDMRSVLVQYIVVGHTSVSSDLSNAIDQFFTGVQMNDQLVTRMERSLQAAIANVETTARSFLLGPARALAFHAGELLGLARYASSLLSEEAAQETHDSCALLLTTVEYTVTQLVEARFRLRDFIAWLRNAGSEVKARGTATNSAQRENARKRRVPKATVGRILSYLQSDTYESTSITESLLGIPVTELLHDGSKFVLSRPSSPTTVASNNSAKQIMERKTPTVLYATKTAESAVAQAFEHPGEFLDRSVRRLDLFLPVERKTEFLPVAIHSRVGKGAPTREKVYYDSEDDTENELGYLSPNVLSDKSLPGISCYDCRQWSVIAKTKSPSEMSGNYTVKLYLIPHQWVDPDEDAEGDFGLGIDAIVDPSECGTPFYLTTEILLPAGGRVLDMRFYGDDGKSNLSSGLDSGSGMEQRQALGVLLSRRKELPSMDDSIELWMLQYDDLVFQPMPTKKDSKQIFLDDGKIDPKCQVLARARVSEDDEKTEGHLIVKTRSIASLASTLAQTASARLMLSGSRGIGGVFTTVDGVTTLEMLDLEEDEEDDDESDEGSEKMDDKDGSAMVLS